VEEVAHLLVRQERAGGRRLVQGDRLLGHLQALAEPRIGPVQVQESPRQRRRLDRHLLQLAERHRIARPGGLGHRLAQVGDQLLVVAGVERLGGRLEDIHQARQHPVGDRPLVGLDLGKVADRDPEALGARLQLPPARFAQGPHLGADEELEAHFTISQTRRPEPPSLRTFSFEIQRKP